MVTGIRCSIATALGAAGFVLYETLVLRGGIGLFAIAALLLLGGVVAWGMFSLWYLRTRAGEYVKGSWLAMWSTIGTLLVVDPLAAALLLPPLSPPIAADPVRHHRLVPGSRTEFRTSEYTYVQHVNSIGLRGTEPRDRDAVGLRILMLGDSFTMGKGVGDAATFSAVLERRLQRDATRPVEVLNAGVDSYAPILEYLQLVQLMPVVRPDVVIMNLDPGDGVQELAYRRQARFGSDGRPLAVVPDAKAPSTPGGRLRDFAMRRTFLARLALYYVYEESGLTPQNVVAAANPAVLANTLASDTVDRTAEFAALFDSIRAAADLCAVNGVRFVLTIYPWGHQVSDDEWAGGRRYFVPDGAQASDRSRLLVAGWAAAQGIELVDAFDAFRQDPGPDRLYYDMDMHWTARGHEILADSLYDHLRDPAPAQSTGR